MSFYRFIFNYLKQHSIPVLKSFFKAYKDTTTTGTGAGGAKNNNSGGGSGQKQHVFDTFFSSMLSKTNMAAPPLTQSTALQILNIQKNIEQLQSQQILKRYYTLFSKNDPKNGGTTYLQSKVFAAKECLMAKWQNAGQLEHEFYKNVIEPELKQQNQQKKKQKEDQDEKK